MEQEFVAKRRKRALGDTRALPRHPPPDGKRPLFPRDLSPTSWLRSCATSATDGAEPSTTRCGMSGPPQYRRAPVTAMPAPLQTCDGPSWSSVSIYSGTITFCAVPLISMHRHVDGLWGIESGPLNIS